MRSSSFETIICRDVGEDVASADAASVEDDLTQCALVFQKNYAAYCMCFHEVAAHYDNFPLINLNDLADVLYEIGIFARERAIPVAESVISKYRTLRETKENEEVLLNRVKFTEVLLLVCEADHDIRAGMDSQS